MEKKILLVCLLAAAIAMSGCLEQPAPIGGDRDEHGCIATAGYVWCEAKNKCIRPWEEECEAGNGALADTLKNRVEELCNEENVAAVFVCGEYIKVASSLMEGGSTFYRFGLSEERGSIAGEGIRCPAVAPDAMSEKCGFLTMGLNCVEKEIC